VNNLDVGHTHIYPAVSPWAATVDPIHRNLYVISALETKDRTAAPLS
jgi:hypothetical protein